MLATAPYGQPRRPGCCRYRQAIAPERRDGPRLLFILAARPLASPRRGACAQRVQEDGWRGRSPSPGVAGRAEQLMGVSELIAGACRAHARAPGWRRELDDDGGLLQRVNAGEDIWWVLLRSGWRWWCCPVCHRCRRSSESPSLPVLMMVCNVGSPVRFSVLAGARSPRCSAYRRCPVMWIDPAARPKGRVLTPSSFGRG